MANLTLHHGTVVIKPADYIYYIHACYILIVGLMGTIENLIVVIIFMRSKCMWTPSNIFIFDLALSDLLICIFGFPFLMISGFYKNWVFSLFGCSCYAFSMSITGMHSVFILAVIATERCKVISQPLKTIKIVSKKRSFILVIFTWILAVCVSFPPMIGWNEFVLEGLQISCSYDMFSKSWKSKSYLIVLIGLFVFTMAIIIICYVIIFFKVQSQTSSMRMMQGEIKNIMKERERKRESKLIAMSINITVAFLVSWGPYALLTILAILNILSEKSSLLMISIPAFFAKTFTLYNPVIYIFTYPKFKKELCKFLRISRKSKLNGSSFQRITFKDNRDRKTSKFNCNDERLSIIEKSQFVYNESRVNGSEIWEIRISKEEESIPSLIEKITRL